ncbi:radical SAM/SPASM domain-containing protein [Salinispora tropica]|uniref:Radical SAM domain protein n=1 Tax=Salinispora tropica (strain ATCC BAA-916 / DSM 44818 / JCM 13857 / NBRC 105044 / CNB-440) TaxID=369723 RepID=A4X6E5_SALTO|nr:radical SAM protein [Salinispora tropica]ABP54445.1 Radical SAM domain protein [Salinispora tropica CNB-440]
MTIVTLPTPALRPEDRDGYGFARLPANAHDEAPERIDRIPYGRFRNVYLYITERCQLRCEHCYMGERLDRALKMPFDQIMATLTTWRQMGGSKLTILGGEPTLHPDYIKVIRHAKQLGYEHVITTSNGLEPAIRKFRRMTPDDFAYVQISLDGGSPDSHDSVRGTGTFDEAVRNVRELVERGFDARIICTVNRANAGDCLRLLDLADEIGVSLVKFHVFSVIGSGHGAAEWGMQPMEWIEFYERLETVAPGYRTRVWYQPTYARRERMARYAADGYRGCIGRTLDRISIFPDGRAYVCSFLFDTDLHFANMTDGKIELNRNANEFDLFTRVLSTSSCGGCKVPGSCVGGCPAEELVMGAASCAAEPDIVPVCRLWKADIRR